VTNTRKVKLGDLGEWGSGGTPLASRADYYGGDIPWLIIEDLNDGIVTKAARTITRSGLRNSSAKMLPVGTLLVAMYGSIGKLGITGLPCATNQAMAFCKCDAGQVDMRFLFFLLIHERAHFINAGRGGTQQNINGEFLREYEVSLPNLTEQQQIAARLEQADRLCRTHRYAHELSDTFLPATFLEFFGDRHQIAREYPTKPLDDVVQADRGITYGIVQAGPHCPEGVPYIKTGDIVDGVICADGLSRTARDIADSYQRSEVKFGDLVMSIRATVGTVAVLPETLDGANLTQGTARIAPGPEVDKLFLLWQIRMPETQRWISRQIKGTTFLEITLGRLRELPVFVPPLSIQQKFAAVVERFERLRAAQRESLRQSEHLFASLLDQAFGD
jgi:type I restriction enzyme S subunit